MLLNSGNTQWVDKNIGAGYQDVITWTASMDLVCWIQVIIGEGGLGEVLQVGTTLISLYIVTNVNANQKRVLFYDTVDRSVAPYDEDNNNKKTVSIVTPYPLFVLAGEEIIVRVKSAAAADSAVHGRVYITGHHGVSYNATTEKPQVDVAAIGGQTPENSDDIAAKILSNPTHLLETDENGRVDISLIEGVDATDQLESATMVQHGDPKDIFGF